MTFFTKSQDVQKAIGACRSHFMAAAGFSLFINVLQLAFPLFSLQVYDRALPSSSSMTLLMLTIMLFWSQIIMGALDYLRAGILMRMGVLIDRMLASRLYGIQVALSTLPSSGTRAQFLRDLDIVRQFLTSNGMHALFDAPWAPIFIAIIFLMHPLCGTLALVGALILLGLAIANELAVKTPLMESNGAATRNYALTDASLRNAEVIQAMGMLPGLLRKWSVDRHEIIGKQVVASRLAAQFTGATKFFRIFIQAAIMALAAYLVIDKSMTIGGMFAVSLILGRALQPVEQVIGAWKGFVTARESYQRLNGVLTKAGPLTEAMPLPAPEGSVIVDRVVFTPQGSDRPILKGVSFALAPGESLGIVGPSAAGKSTLARMLVGVWRPTSGVVRLDNADIAAWERSDVGRHIGYLPQDIELFSGTVRDNIARFTDAPPEAIIEAAQKAGVHDLILRLPKGYETEIGDAGAVLSGGQRQRIGLARAVFGRPRLLVLDEPNSNLDVEGEEALRNLILRLKSEGVTVVVIAHRNHILSAVDKILILRDGAVDIVGPRAEVMAKMMGQASPMPQRTVVGSSS